MVFARVPEESNEPQIIAKVCDGNNCDLYGSVCVYHTTSHTNGNETHTPGTEVGEALDLAEDSTKLRLQLTMMTAVQVMDLGYTPVALFGQSEN